MKRTTDAMKRGLSDAVVELRARMQWGQMELASQIRAQGRRLRVELLPTQETISRWENGGQAPSPEYRMVLSKIAAKHRHEDLAELFRAPISAWRLVGTVHRGLKREK